MIANSAPPRQDIPASSNLHEPFLRRAADAEDGNASGVALGAFLTLRLADVFDERFDRLSAEAIDYQIRATGDYLRDLNPVTTEVKHQIEIVRAAQTALDRRNRDVLWPSLLAYAHWLEHQLRLDEALDVLDTAMGLSVEDEGEEALRALMQQARVLRKSNKFDDARTLYVYVGELATRLGDHHSQLLSRIGLAIVCDQRGNLPDAERILRDVLSEAEKLNDQEAMARASHDLACTLDNMGRTNEGIPLAYRAFEIYEDDSSRLRALSDLGTLLKRVGMLPASSIALTVVAGQSPSAEMRATASMELMEVAGLMRNRLGFEKWRKAAGSYESSLSGGSQAHFEFKLGMSLARFGENRRALLHLARAVSLANEHQAYQLAFDAEQALTALEKAAHEFANTTTATTADPAVAAVAQRLGELEESAAAS